MKLFIIRHGQSVGNTKRGFISGQSDPEGLSEVGKTQVIRTAWELRHHTFNHIISSPVARAYETGSIISRLLNIPITKNEAFAELNYGEVEGHFWWDVKDKLMEKGNVWKNFDISYPGGESLRDLFSRVYDEFHTLVKNTDPASSIIITTHDAVMGAICYTAVNYEKPKEDLMNDGDVFIEFIHNMQTPNASVIQLHIDADEVTLEETLSNFPPVEVHADDVSFYTKAITKESKFSVSYLKTVSENDVYKLEGDKKYIFKLLKDKNILDTTHLVSLYKYLHSHHFPTPYVVHSDLTHLFFDHDILLQDYEEGHTQKYCLENHGEHGKVCLKRVIEIVDNIHAIPAAEVEEFWYSQEWGGTARPTWLEYMTVEIEKTTKQLPKFDIKPEVKQIIEKALEELKHYVMSTKYKLVPLHGDLSANNIIVQDKCDFIKIVDFERARIGDLVWDYVYYHGYLERQFKHAANELKELVFEKFSSEQKHIFQLYRVLFHAWTVRDMFDYDYAENRSAMAQHSLDILNSLSQ